MRQVKDEGNKHRYGSVLLHCIAHGTRHTARPDASLQLEYDSIGWTGQLR